MLTKMDADRSLTRSLGSRDSLTSSINQAKSQKEFWIEKSINKRECIRFVRPSGANGAANPIDKDRCCCGHHRLAHERVITDFSPGIAEPWQLSRDTTTLPTDSFGQIDFQGPHPNKAQYVRLDYMSSPETVLKLLLHHWQLELPKLLISVHGGIANFDLQPKLKRVFNKGLIKAANTTGAWIITGGTNTGVIKHVGQALGEKSAKKKKKRIVAIGIAPWGIVHKRRDLISRDESIDYHSAAHPRNGTAVLNSSHNYFLLSDNGTEGKYGADFTLRKKLERYISHQRIQLRGEKNVKGCGVPLVCVVLEGGSNTIRTVLDYLTEEPPVPIVVCDGSGRAADLLSFTHKYSNEDGALPFALKGQLVATIRKTFSYNTEQAERLYYELVMCLKKKKFITVFRMGEANQDIDLPILTALLTCHNTSAAHQLGLVLSWDREDVARSHIFTYGQEWPEGVLDHAMLVALVQNKVDFVELLLEKGVNVRRFLTCKNLEELYNTRVGSTSTLQMMVREVRKRKQPNARITLIEVGQIIELLLGGAFRSNYNRRKFKHLYQSHVMRNTRTNVADPLTAPEESPFSYPFSDLLIWAVLLKRQKMAKFMWRREEEALPKAIIACKLYRALADEAIDEPLLDNEVSEELLGYAREFQKLALDILDHLYKECDDTANQLLTYELKSFSNQTCISLAHSAGMKDFLAHPCCQNLITDMWMGGLRMTKSSLRIVLGIVCPPTIPSLDFKTKKELQLMPQTVEEHIEELEDSENEATDDRDADLEIDATSFIENLDVMDEDEVSQIVTWQPANRDIADSSEGAASSSSLLKHSAEGDRLVAANGNPPQNLALTSSMLEKMKRLKRRQEQLKLGKKFYEFYTAPVTKFWMHTMGYVFFLALFNFLVLFELSRYQPRWPEIYIMLYIFTHLVEMIREIAVSEPVKFTQKLWVFFKEFWNILDGIAILLFWIGVALRFSHDDFIHLTGRVFYCCDIIFWYIRILELFSVSKNLGPYVVIVAKMIMDMLNFIVILLIVLLSFGVSRQSILHPHVTNQTWDTIKNVFLEPYFMLYGEVYAGSIDAPCGNGDGLTPCVPGHWITPAIMSVYLLVANILLLNLLIAVFNSTFQRTSHNSREIWMFQRYSLTLEYEIKPILPAPFILFSFIYLAIKWIVRRCKGKPPIRDYGLKLFLHDDEVKKLHDFEEDCVDDYFTNLEMKFESSTEERIRVTHDRVENILMKINDINQKENQLKLSMQSMEIRISSLEELGRQTHGTINQILAVTTLENYERSRRLQELAGGLPNTTLSSSSLETSSPPLSHDRLLSVDVDNLASLNERVRRYSGDSPRKQTHPITIPARHHPLRPDRGSSLLRRRKANDLKPLRAPVNPSSEILSRGRSPDLPRFPLDTGDETTGPSHSAAAGLPSIKESMPGTPTEDISHSHRKSAPICEMEHHRVATRKSLPVSTRVESSILTDVTDGSEASTEPMSPDVSMRSQSSPKLFSARSLAAVNLNTTLCHGRSDPIHIPISPTVHATPNEYISITDSIDTSCILASPLSSPSSSYAGSRFFFGPQMDASDAARLFPGVATSSNPEREYLAKEMSKLKHAEETETQVIGSVMRTRIRQISVDDSHSMSNLAQKIVSDFGKSPRNSAIFDNHGSTDLSSTLPAATLRDESNAFHLTSSNHF